MSSDPAQDDLTVVFVGDLMLGRAVNEALEYQPPEYPWGDTLEIFRRADFRIANLECVIADRGLEWPDKAFHFRSASKNVAVLKTARIDAVSLANNHSLDFGYDALADMLVTLRRANIKYAGAGKNRAEAFAPGVTTATHTKIGLISFTDNEPEWEAMPDKPGIAYVPVDFEEERATWLFDAITRARRQVDVLVVAVHWGPNWGYQPPPRQIPFAHRMVELGADVIFGHSGHVFRGVEIYRGRPIIYCAGNFVDDYAVDPDERNDQSFIFVLELSQSRPRRLKLHPTVVVDCQAWMADRTQARSIAAKMQELCSMLGTAAKWNSSERRLEIEIS